MNQTMQSQFVGGFSILFALLYIAFFITVVIYALWLLGRFVGAHERLASSLDIIARKMKDEVKL